MQVLTHSRIDTFKVCRRRHWYAYELGIRRDTDGKARRMGSAYHDGIEALATTGSLDLACQRVYGRYDSQPDVFNEQEWLYERETVLRLICGYDWRWQDEPLNYVAAELPWKRRLINPATGAASKVFELAGKIDGIVALADGRGAVIEHKCLSEDLGSDSPLWRRLRIDHQISLYVLMARELGHRADCVLYNVCRKPTIKPTNIPVLDELGAKIVLSEFGTRVKTDRGQWRQTGDTARGFVLQTRPMTEAEWGEKLAEDIVLRPEFYYARREIARLDIDLNRYAAELWQIQKTIRDAQNHDRHYLTCNRNTCEFCDYFDICCSGQDVTSGALPEGFVKLEDLHPELEGTFNDTYQESAAGPTAGEETLAAAPTN
jgi:hypothetical protein